MDLKTVLNELIPQAFEHMPRAWRSKASDIMILAIGLQESGFLVRKQMGNGPARSFWQFEMGNPTSRGGVWGVMHHEKTAAHAKRICAELDVPFDAKSVWQAMETNDVLGICFARLLLLIDRRPLPGATGSVDTAWDIYNWCWRPGKPHPEKWPANYAAAVKAVEA